MKGIVLQDWSATYVQEKDTWDSSKEICQNITLKAEDATGEGDYFLVLETQRWALDQDEIEEWAEQLKRFLKGEIVSEKLLGPKLASQENQIDSPEKTL